MLKHLQHRPRIVSVPLVACQPALIRGGRGDRGGRGGRVPLVAGQPALIRGGRGDRVPLVACQPVSRISRIERPRRFVRTASSRARLAWNQVRTASSSARGGRLVLLIALALAFLLLTGCTPYRLVIDVTSPTERLVETTVHSDAKGWGSDRIALIDLAGVIADRDTSTLLAAGGNPVGSLFERLRKAEHDDRVKAIVLRVNSPGGTVAASETIYLELRRFRERSGKPIVVQMGEVAASGGYYISLAGDKLIAQPTTVTGSIGVLIQLVNLSRTMRLLGVNAEAVVSGPNKTMGSPLEPEDPQHRELFQGIVDEFYASFRSLVAERRGLSEDVLDEMADGRIMTGAQAQRVGLVDETGTLLDAFAAAKDLAGIDHAKLVKYHRPSQRVASAYDAVSSAPAETEVNVLQVKLDNLLGGTSGFYYLWAPGIE
jgi:protease IV